MLMRMKSNKPPLLVWLAGGARGALNLSGCLEKLSRPPLTRCRGRGNLQQQAPRGLLSLYPAKELNPGRKQSPAVLPICLTWANLARGTLAGRAGSECVQGAGWGRLRLETGLAGEWAEQGRLHPGGTGSRRGRSRWVCKEEREQSPQGSNAARLRTCSDLRW